MENKGLSAEQLNMIPHDVMVQMYLQQTEAYRTLLAQNNQLLAQNEELIRKVGSLEEKLAVMNQRMFGRKIERIAAMNSDQLRLSDIDPALVLNEAEVLTEDGIPEEPGEETITYTRKKKKGKREEDLQYVDEVREVRHEASYSRICRQARRRRSQGGPSEQTVHEDPSHTKSRCGCLQRQICQRYPVEQDIRGYAQA